MTSKQMDALQAMADAADAFIHAFSQDYPTMTAKIEADAASLEAWVQSNPVPE